MIDKTSPSQTCHRLQSPDPKLNSKSQHCSLCGRMAPLELQLSAPPYKFARKELEPMTSKVRKQSSCPTKQVCERDIQNLTDGLGNELSSIDTGGKPCTQNKALMHQDPLCCTYQCPQYPQHLQHPIFLVSLSLPIIIHFESM